MDELDWPRFIAIQDNYNLLARAGARGALKPKHIDDALAALSITLTDEEAKRLEAPYTPRPENQAYPVWRCPDHRSGERHEHHADILERQ